MPFPQSTGVFLEPEEPLQSCPLHPARRFGYQRRMEIKCRANVKHDQGGRQAGCTICLSFRLESS